MNDTSPKTIIHTLEISGKKHVDMKVNFSLMR